MFTYVILIFETIICVVPPYLKDLPTFCFDVQLHHCSDCIAASALGSTRIHVCANFNCILIADTLGSESLVCREVTHFNIYIYIYVYLFEPKSSSPYRNPPFTNKSLLELT